MYTQALPPKTASLLRLFAEKKPDFLSSFYLSGGTALSLQLGHRESEDLDFFNEHTFKPDIIELQLYPLETYQKQNWQKAHSIPILTV